MTTYSYSSGSCNSPLSRDPNITLWQKTKVDGDGSGELVDWTQNRKSNTMSRELIYKETATK